MAWRPSDRRPTSAARCLDAVHGGCVPAARRARRRRGATPPSPQSYRRQAAELGWYSMLVPEALGGGSVSGNGVARRGADRLPARRAAAAGLVRRHQRRGLRRGRRRQRRAARRGAAGAARRRGARRRGPWPAPATPAASTAVSTPRVLDDGGLELTGTKTAVQDVEPSSWLLVTAPRPTGRRRRWSPPTPTGSPSPSSTRSTSAVASPRSASTPPGSPPSAVVGATRRSRRAARRASWPSPPR